MPLNDYITGVQLLLHDTAGSFYSTPNLTRWINEARRRVAGDSECIRTLASGITVSGPGSLASVTLTSGGAGYSVLGGSNATISAPDQIGGVQATVGIHLTAGAVDNVFITNPGSGYSITPSVTFHGPGSGASAFATLTTQIGAMVTTQGVEKYSFALATPSVRETLGVSNVLWVRQVTVSWGSLKPALAYEPFTRLQAYYRAYSIGIQNFPSIWSQYGQGEAGTIYFWPIPSQQLSMDWDCVCQPLPLTADVDPEAIPLPFTDAVKYYAAYLALMYAQRTDDAAGMKQLYMGELRTARANTGRAFTANYYYAY